MKMRAIVTVLILFTGLFAVCMLMNASFKLEPYMDEIFHIPQAIKYCEGNFLAWDPKITTYPGLYIVSAALHFLFWQTPSTTSLRLCNVFFTTALFYGLILYRQKIVGRDSDSLMVPLLIITTPLVGFYTFLFYTDILSLLMVVLMGLLSQDSQSASSKSSGKKRGFRSLFFQLLVVSGSILARQTNAVWAVFFAGADTLMYLRTVGTYRDGEDEINGTTTGALLSALWKHRTTLLSGVWWPYLIPVIIFVAFSYHNGSIVLGDKENHVMSAHWAMPLHAFAVTLALTFPIVLLDSVRFGRRVLYTALEMLSGRGKTDISMLDRIEVLYSVCTLYSLESSYQLDDRYKKLMSPVSTYKRIQTRSRSQKNSHIGSDDDFTPGQRMTRICLGLIGHLLGCAAVTVCLVKFSFSHPFLLSDNRHYTFYLWRRFLQYPTVRAMLGPMYYVAVCVLISRLRGMKGPLWIFGFLLASCLKLVPTPLLEPRYFTPVITLALLHSVPASTTTEVVLWSVRVNARHMMWISVLMNAAVTAVLLIVFLFRPFAWPDGSVARFMP